MVTKRNGFRVGPGFKLLALSFTSYKILGRLFPNLQNGENEQCT